MHKIKSQEKNLYSSSIANINKRKLVFGKNEEAADFITLFYVALEKPLVIWQKNTISGAIKRVNTSHDDIPALHILGSKVLTSSISSPPDNFTSLGIKLPILGMALKSFGRPFAFEVQVIDTLRTKRRIRFSNIQVMSRISAQGIFVHLSLDSGCWNELSIDLNHLIRVAYGTRYRETTRIQIFPNCYLRAVYFSSFHVPIETAVSLIQKSCFNTSTKENNNSIKDSSKLKLVSSKHGFSRFLVPTNLQDFLIYKSFQNLHKTKQLVVVPTPRKTIVIPKSKKEIASSVSPAPKVSASTSLSVLDLQSEDVQEKLLAQMPQLQNNDVNVKQIDIIEGEIQTSPAGSTAIPIESNSPPQPIIISKPRKPSRKNSSNLKKRYPIPKALKVKSLNLNRSIVGLSEIKLSPKNNSATRSKSTTSNLKYPRKLVQLTGTKTVPDKIINETGIESQETFVNATMKSDNSDVGLEDSFEDNEDMFSLPASASKIELEKQYKTKLPNPSSLNEKDDTTDFFQTGTTATIPGENANAKDRENETLHSNLHSPQYETDRVKQNLDTSIADGVGYGHASESKPGYISSEKSLLQVQNSKKYNLS